LPARSGNRFPKNQDDGAETKTARDKGEISQTGHKKPYEVSLQGKKEKSRERLAQRKNETGHKRRNKRQKNTGAKEVHQKSGGENRKVGITVVGQKNKKQIKEGKKNNGFWGGGKPEEFKGGVKKGPKNSPPEITCKKKRGDTERTV